LPWLLEGTVVASGAFIILTAPESERKGGHGAGEQFSPRRALTLIRTSLSTCDLGVLVGYTALLFGVLNTLEIYVQPVSTTILGVAPTHLGFVYAGLTLVSAIIVARSGWLKSQIGVRQWFTGMPLILALALISVAVVPLFALPAFFLARGISRASRPLFNQYLNNRTLSEGRATVLSGASAIRSLATAPLNVLGGVLTGLVSVTMSIGLLGLLLLAGSILAVVVWKPNSDSSAD
jgi:predicted MFS family arabinose efflux permease